MGWGKKLKKAIKKVTKQVEKVAKAPIDAVTGGAETQVVEQQAAPAAQPAPAPAQVVEPPKADDVETEDGAQTESDKRKARAGGKKSLSVARSAGGGLNI
ncbi:putative virion assembly protein [Erwinia phage pEp_SNUABM_10]|uniref:Putative virion assembly protein n=1 Tax=Erwinia phage pEp_SNUABM_09 TaxID=2601644 RepID=A0A5J6DA27_9CAUD|nr:putative virion assembly protein [Erwinia phage pEp_SNUABM_09]QOC57621.1 putative virion assembly protein [Erwinia phage pEp_SNUABM_03]QOC57676.1 putative virion assembly protein [Erwinia phage pEp_SNUABM_04]QOC57726.1 putative virion assembly protein [Erwinia phage pEp_SNUABM_10]QOC57779.1 putative virion assembly protein [Erwinia phage pEp_SNUABM_11]